jgi:uncharacterized SAM-binding protein YcdF (DUF218 family)
MQSHPEKESMRRSSKSFVWACILFLLVLVGAAALANPILCLEKPRASADFIIVLGGDTLRAAKALELFKAGIAPNIIVTGEGEAQELTGALLRGGVPRQNIFLEENSRNTEENALFTVRILRQKEAASAILVTSWFHTRRALACFRHFGPEINFGAFAARHPERMSVRFTHVYQEYAKTAWYSVRYGIFPWGA